MLAVKLYDGLCCTMRAAQAARLHDMLCISFCSTVADGTICALHLWCRLRIASQIHTSKALNLLHVCVSHLTSGNQYAGGARWGGGERPRGACTCAAPHGLR